MIANDGVFRVTRRTMLPVPKWRRLDEIPLIDPRDNSIEAAIARHEVWGDETYAEDIPVRKLWEAFNLAAEELRKRFGDDGMPPLVHDVYFGKCGRA